MQPPQPCFRCPCANASGLYNLNPNYPTASSYGAQAVNFETPVDSVPYVYQYQSNRQQTPVCACCNCCVRATLYQFNNMC